MHASQFNRLFIILIGVCIVMAGLTGLLFVEYRFFKRQAQTLVDLQNQYREGMIALRQSLDECTCTLPDEKKKDELIEQLFVTVNREPAYLKQSALNYVKRKSPERLAAVNAWYESCSAAVFRSTQKKKKPRTRVKNYPTYIQRAMMRRPAYIDIHFSWPIERSRFWISSPFGPRKNSNGSPGFHYGLDMAALRGTPIYAAGSGRVIEAGENTGYGKTVVVLHTRRYKTRYAHLSTIAVRVGQSVRVGQKIGTVGATGNVRKTGKDASHLHFEVYANGKQVNPIYFLV